MLDAQIAHQAASVMTAVNYGELKISQNPSETLVAFSIGSGIGVSMYDPVIKAGGLLNFVLPDSATMSAQKAQCHPFMFADTGLSALSDALHAIGSKTANLRVVVAGGAQILDQTTVFNIGHKNHKAVTSFLNGRNLAIHYSDTGGIFRRTLRLDIGSGGNLIQTQGQGEVNV